jgi:hypothetical protein
MDNNDQNQRTELLSDAPAEDDAFEGGHDRVARALAGLIQEEDGGKAVALKGPFGSGKSTVVRLLENELDEVDKEKNEDTRIFTYDAWEHQGDPLRRSFIESLVEFLEEEGWADEGEWKDEIDRIARRKEETEHKTEPVLTEWGRSVALALFLSPLGLAGFAVFARGAIGEVQAQNPSSGWLAGFAALAVVSLVIFFLPLVQYWRAKRNTDDEDGDPFYLFFQKTQEKKKTKTIRTPDPTTIEFQEIFRDIISEALKDDSHQLIFVVDNLDRLPPEQALSTWATMRTFFETEGANEDKWMGRFWLIVPLNFEALRGVFTEGASTRKEEKRTGQNDDSEEGRDRELGAADSVEAFANKTFSTVFRVAPPVLSDWEQFMKDQLSEAFDLDKSEDAVDEIFHSVYRLYRITGVEDNSIPTPRDIKIFINRLSGLYRQWDEEIGLPMLAAYQLKGDEISQDGQDLTDTDFLTPRIKAELRNGHWQKQFAALHFNVDPDKATQVLIEEQVQTALETGNEEETLEEYSSIAGFANVIDRVIPKIARGDDPKPISLAAVALDTVSIGAEDVELEAWRKLRNGIRAARDWYPEEEREGEGLLKIIRRAPEFQQDALAQDILATVSSVDLDVSVQDFPNDATNWTDGLLPLVRAFKDREDLLRDTFHVPKDWPTYISVISHLEWEEDAQNLAPFFIPADGADPDGIDAAIADMVSADSISSAHLSGLKLAEHIEQIANADWTKTSDAIYGRLNWKNSISDEKIRIHLKTALVIAADYEFQYLWNKLGDGTGRANLSHHLQNYWNDDLGITALCVLLRVLYSAGKNRGNNHGNASQGHNHFTDILQNPDGYDSIVEETANVVEEFSITQDLLDAAVRWQNDAPDFVRKVVQKIATKSKASALLDYSAIVKHPDIVGEALQGKEEQFKTLVLEADQDGRLSEHLGSLDQDDWLKRLKNEDRVLDIALILIEEKDLQLPSAFQNALHEHAKWIVNQQSPPSRLQGNEWNQLLKALGDAKRNSFLLSLQRTLLSKAGESLVPVLSMYGDSIDRSGVVAEVSVPTPTETVNERFRPLLQRGNPEELEWLSNVLEGHPDLIKDTDDIGAAFQELIRDEYAKIDEGEKTGKQLERIADLADVDLTEPGDSEGEEAEEEGE